MTHDDAARGEAIARSGKYIPKNELSTAVDSFSGNGDERLDLETFRSDESVPPPPEPPPDDDPGAIFHAAHLGMARKLVKSHGKKLLHVHGLGWHHWDGTRWAPDETAAAPQAVHTLLRSERRKALKLKDTDRKKREKEIARYETAGAITGILTVAATLPEFAATVADLDTDPWLLNCANGTLDLRTGELRRHNPKDRITKTTRGAYHTGCTSTEWTSFLTRVLPDQPVRDYLHRLTGMSLYGAVNGDKELLPVLVGTGANGKSTCVDTIVWALGDYAFAAEPDLLLTKYFNAATTGLVDLLGRRFVSTVETGKGRTLDLPLMKRLTGGDTITGRRLYRDNITFAPSHLLIMATNHLPRVEDNSEAVWRRLRVIRFDECIPVEERDPELKERLKLDADAVLTWMVDGWLLYREQGLDEPESVTDATDGYKTDSDTVGTFIREECVTGADKSDTTKALYERFVEFTGDGARAISKRDFGRELDDRGYPYASYRHGRPRVGIALITLTDPK
jgi:putative DNA primase/helicase